MADTLEVFFWPENFAIRLHLSSTATDPQTGNDPQIGPQMIPPENEEWHGVCSSGRGFNY